MLGAKAFRRTVSVITLTATLAASPALARDESMKPTVCTISLDDAKHDLDAFRKATKHTPNEGSRYFELTPTEEARKQTPDMDWLSYACRRASDSELATYVHCDTLVITGHYNGGFMGRSGLSVSREDLEK